MELVWLLCGWSELTCFLRGAKSLVFSVNMEIDLNVVGGVIRLNLGRRLVNLLPVAKRTNALTNGVVDRPWVVGREFESHVHHENAF